jgi:hypothetical protein
VSTVRGSFGSQGRFSRNIIGVAATGGNITTAGGYGIHTFVTGARTGGTFTFTPNGWGNVEVLLVGGGGNGATTGSGGGAGGLIYNTSVSVNGTNTYSVVVGGGSPGDSVNGNPGYDPGSNGENSTFAGLTAFGGGRGLTHGNPNGVAGGSGSGAPVTTSTTYTGIGGEGTAGQGNKGGDMEPAGGSWVGCSGGGGGAGEAGYKGLATNVTANAASNVLNGRGGNGLANSISGSSVTYAGGGGGGEVNLDWCSPQVPTGGGGIARTNDTGTSGTNGLGGGGGGGAFGGSLGPASGESGGPYWRGGSGGSGVVVVRYTI